MIYVHVPFCKSRCIYCDFYSTTANRDWQRRYVEALIRETWNRQEEIKKAQADTIYIGGGSPSVLPMNALKQIFATLNDVCGGLDTLAECTIEANPDDVTEEWVQALRDTPVDRVSMGAQSMDNEMLCTLGRRHTAEQVYKAVERLRREGYENISLDLMYGLPGQTIEGWERDVHDLLAVGVPHISAYALQVEEGTALCKRLREGSVASLPDDDDTAQMYELLLDKADAAGYIHYEISNFARSGYEAKHNSGYWNGKPYVGLGPGAHSYDGHRVRRSNSSNLAAYCSDETVPHEKEVLTDEELYNETVLTRLRTRDGLDVTTLDDEQRKYTMKIAQKHIKRGMMTCEGSILRLKREGIFVSNDIISDFML